MIELAATLSISLSDIALLANVQRPVVSMWRTRSAHTSMPFPAPTAVERGQERFDARQIADWLEATGRGNNSQARDDVAAFASVDGARIDDPAVFNALTALLCLKVVSGTELGGMSQVQLLDLADDYDPDDAYLYSELDALGDRLPNLARYADLLASAAYSPRDAFEKLMGERFRAGIREQSTAALSQPARELVAKIAHALASGLPSDRPTYLDSTPGGSDLAIELVRRYGDDSDLTVVTTPGDSPAARLARRRLRVHDAHQPTQASTTHDRQVIHVTHLPGPAAPQMSDAQILTAVDDIVLQMDDSHRAVIVAPASALTDSTRSSEIDGPRDDVLRTGRVRVIVRLPKGLIPSKSRQALALWVLGPAHKEDPAERRAMIADLINEPLRPDVIDDLVTDIVACVAGESIRTHSFRFTRPVLTRALLTTKQSLVAHRVIRQPATTQNAADLLPRINSALAALDSPSLELGARDLTPATTSPEADPPGPTTIDSAIRAGHIKMIPGNRIDPAEFTAGGGAGVIGPDELIGATPLGSRAVDRLDFTGNHPSGRFSEPGDIVFCASPRPAATIDADGGSVVAFPARILRVNREEPGDLIAEIVAADINSAPAGAREWRLWQVRRTPRGQHKPLAARLEALRRERSATLARLARLDELTELLTDGVTSGALALTDADDPAKGIR